MTRLHPENLAAIHYLKRVRDDERKIQALAREEAEELYEARVHNSRQAVAEAIVHARSLDVPTPWVKVREALGTTHHGAPFKYIDKEEEQ